MTEFTIVLGNKAYSSWSLRGWLMLKQTGVAFSEVIIPLDRPQTKAEILAHSPSGRVPALKAGKLTIWDSLAIAEYLDERFPGAGLWPQDPEARAVARAVTGEMHAGFATLRARLPMDLKRDPAPAGESTPPDPELAAEIGRIVAIWTDCRARYGGRGDFLFGAFTAADAVYAPVATRFQTYGVVLPEPAATYRDAVMAWPALGEWIVAAREEPWIIEFP